MKRIAWLVSLVACLSLILGGVAAASVPGPEVGHWEWYRGEALTQSQWVWFGPQNADSLARCFRAGTIEQTHGLCNKSPWEIPVEIHASVAQWIEWNLTGVEWHWKVLKPGIYAADCIEYTIFSNQDVTVTFSGFEHLKADDWNKTDDDDDEIEIYYLEGDYGAATLPPPGGPAWLSPGELNDASHTFVNSNALHYTGEGGKLNCYIDVSRCNSACEYRDEALITLTLVCQKHWVDADGSWWDIQ